MTAIAMPSICYGSPKDWDDFFWDTYKDFLAILHRACYPDGIERWIKGDQSAENQGRA